MIHPRLWGESVPYVCKGELLQTTLYAEHRRVVFYCQYLALKRARIVLVYYFEVAMPLHLLCYFKQSANMIFHANSFWAYSPVINSIRYCIYHITYFT